MRHPPRSRQAPGAALLLLALLAAAARAAEEPATVMDPVFIEASASNPWKYASIPGFEILSKCTDGFTQDFAWALGRSTAARLAVLPPDLWGDLPTPMKMVLYDRPTGSDHGIGWASPIDLSWTAEDGALVGSGGVQRSYPVTLGDWDTFINCGNYRNVQDQGPTMSVDPDSAIRLSCRVPRLPAWFVTGMVGPRGLYSNRRITASASGASVVMPNALWTTSAETIEIQDEVRRGAKVRAVRPMLPLSAVFDGRYPEERRGLWEAEAALLVRWGLYKSGDRGAFLDFVRRSAEEPPSEALFRRFLGIGYGEALHRLGAYLPEASSTAVTVPVDLPSARPAAIREAGSREVARILGDWGRFEGRSSPAEGDEYRRECVSQADRLFSRARERRSSDPLFLAAYGLYEEEAGNDTLAAEALEAAAAAGIVRPRAYVELARLTLEGSLSGVPRGIGDLSPAQFERILGLLATARAQMPSLESTYYLIARVYEHAPDWPRRPELGALDEALRLFPQDARLAYRIATVFRRLGYPSAAAEAISRADAFSESARARELLASFHAQ
jgi:hypothetical protein